MSDQRLDSDIPEWEMDLLDRQVITDILRAEGFSNRAELVAGKIMDVRPRRYATTDLIHELTPPFPTAEQEIRARALGSAARLFGPVFAAMVEPGLGGERVRTVLNTITEAWLTAGIVAANYIDSPAPVESPEPVHCYRCGGPCRGESDDPAEPAPSQDATGAAEGEAVDVR